MVGIVPRMVGVASGIGVPIMVGTGQRKVGGDLCVLPALRDRGRGPLVVLCGQQGSDFVVNERSENRDQDDRVAGCVVQ